MLCKLKRIAAACALACAITCCHAAEPNERLAAQLAKAGENRTALESALAAVPSDQRAGMEFLVENMPDRDLTSLSSEFLLENVRLAYAAIEAAPWRERVSQEMFFNDVLPYAVVNETRDAWRREFRERFAPLVQEVDSPARAAAILNQRIFNEINVRYSTQRPKADQSPLESMECGLASCTGLSVLLIDACRAVGVPARFAGTPLWSDNSGNHSWVEVWDDRWRFTGAAEPTGDDLDRGWFTQRASQAMRDDRRRAIYASSFRRTPLSFPCVWDQSVDYVFAVNVTDRYTAQTQPLEAGQAVVGFRVLDGAGGDRCQAQLRVRDLEAKTILEAESKDERFDANDHTTAILRHGERYVVEASASGRTARAEFEAAADAPPVTLVLSQAPTAVDAGDGPVAELTAYLAVARSERTPLSDQAFALAPLSRDEANRARELHWADHVAAVKESRADEMRARVLVDGELKMPFDYRVFGDKPERGRSLFISLHGGGGAPARVNDQQWENQKRLYEPNEGVYLAPRAPTDTWDLWHQPHIDRLFARLIENLIVLEDVDPNRVYVMGYSAGGDGVYQLAPRMADRWAAAAMMAGHPNDAAPLSLRNTPFTLHVGGDDGAYQRNEVAAAWAKQLGELRGQDAGGYVHWAKVYPGKGHWLDREDAAALAWMAGFERNPLPSRVVWVQDDVTHDRFYWLAVDDENARAGSRVIADVAGQRIDLRPTGVPSLRVRLNDELVDLDEPVEIVVDGEQVFAGRSERTIATIAKTLAERGDPRDVFSAEVVVDAAAAED